MTARETDNSVELQNESKPDTPSSYWRHLARVDVFPHFFVARDASLGEDLKRLRSRRLCVGSPECLNCIERWEL